MITLTAKLNVKGTNKNPFELGVSKLGYGAVFGAETDVEMQLDERAVKTISAELMSRADIEQPSWGIVSNKASIDFNDSFRKIATYIEQRVIEGSKCTLFLKNSQKNTSAPVAVYYLTDCDYDSDNRSAQITLKDRLEQLQENAFGSSYDVLPSQGFDALQENNLPTMKSVYNKGRSYSLGFGGFYFNSSLPTKFDSFLNNTACQYPILKAKSLWEFWDKFCRACGCYIYSGVGTKAPDNPNYPYEDIINVAYEFEGNSAIGKETIIPSKHIYEISNQKFIKNSVKTAKVEQLVFEGGRLTEEFPIELNYEINNYYPYELKGMENDGYKDLKYEVVDKDGYTHCYILFSFERDIPEDITILKDLQLSFTGSNTDANGREYTRNISAADLGEIATFDDDFEDNVGEHSYAIALIRVGISRVRICVKSLYYVHSSEGKLYNRLNIKLTAIKQSIASSSASNSNGDIEFSVPNVELVNEGTITTADGQSKPLSQFLADNLADRVYGHYKNGKETATVKCAIANYNSSGNGEISKTDSECFNISDIVIPMVYGADGKDQPMSRYSNGTPKAFSVVGRKLIYDGAVWQELTLQEVAQNL